MKKFIALTIVILMGSNSAIAQNNKVDLNPKDTRTYSEKERARSEAEVKRAYETVQQEKKREEMRDKAHDNRLNIDKNTSIAPGMSSDKKGGEVNVKKTY